jgi:predicted NACHT family NTPase
MRGTKKYSLKTLAISGRLGRLKEDELISARYSDGRPTKSYLNFRRQLNRGIILGDPGGGKSTLTQLLCFDLARTILLEDKNPDRPEYESRDLKLPLKVVLRSFEAKQKVRPSYNFLTYLCDDLKLALDNDYDLTMSVLQSVMSTGGAFLIFDGLDEVLDVGARRDVVNQVEQFATLYAACPILITSRLVGYRDAPISEDFEPYGLARFNVEEVRSYATKSILTILNCLAAEAELKADDFVRQTDKIGGDLRKNPLMLGLMIHIFVNNGEVPSNRPEIYKECASLMFEKWDGRRDIVVRDVPRTDIELLDVFGYVASRVFGDASREEGVPKAWLTAELRKHFEGWYIDRASANRASSSLVEFLIGRAWVMSEVGSGIFKFTHRTFLEYFFARNLISESRTMEDLIEGRLLSHMVKNEWGVISYLALHMAVFRDGGKSKQAADVLIRLIEVDRTPDEELAFLEFTAGSFDYLTIAEGMYVHMVTLMLHRTIALGSREYSNAPSVGRL